MARVMGHMGRPVLMALAVFLFATECAAKAEFPLSVEPGGHHLVDARGEPFFLHGDTAWSLMAQLRREEIDLYLRDRRERGFNTILVSLIERKFAREAPRNAYGELPFAGPAPFEAPNEAYFAHVDWALKRAGDEGFLVLLAPNYAGFNGGEEGWYPEMEAAGPARLRAYGEYLGHRYSEYDNILWVHGGDFDPPNKSLVRAVAEGIKAYHPQALHTVHGAPGFSSLDNWRAEEWLDVNAVYTYGPVHEKVTAQKAFDPRIPSFLIESTYENEHGATGRSIRIQAYQALLTGAVGHVFGNNPIWHFDGPAIYAASIGWKEALASEGAQSMAHLAKLMAAVPWWTLAPDDTNKLLVEGTGPPDSRAVAAVAEDRSLALVYLPDAREIVIDLTELTGSLVTARWYDPAEGSFTIAADSPIPPEGRHRFGAPSAVGTDGDRLLVLEVEP